MNKTQLVIVALFCSMFFPPSLSAKDFSWGMFLPAITGKGSGKITPIVCDPQNLYACTNQTSCEGAGGSWYDNKCNTKINGIIGVSQKGPMMLGSSVSIYAVNDQLDYTGDIYAAQVRNNMGEFTYTGTLTSPYVEVIIQGFFYDEIGGKLSPAQLTIRDLSSTKSKINVNLLTTIEINRIKNLMLEGLGYDAAKSQAELEILTSFHINGVGFSAFSDMDISGSSDSDAALLAISSVILQMAYNDAASESEVVATLSFMLSNMATDLEYDGTLSKLFSDKYLMARANVVPVSVRTNLENYYAQLGQSYTAPPFEKYLNETPSSFDFTDISDAAAQFEYTTNSITVSGLSNVGIAPFTVVSTNGASLDNIQIVKNGVTLPNDATTVLNGDSIQLKILSGDFNTILSYKTTIGTLSDNISLTTRNPLIAYRQGLPRSVFGPPGPTAIYFALPFESNKASNIRYMGIGLYTGEETSNTATVQSVAVYTNNSGVPGVVIATTSLLGSYFKSKTYNDLDGNPVTGVMASIEAFFGVGGFDITANTRYWIVVKYSESFATGVQGVMPDYGNLPYSTRKLSNDGMTWSNWYIDEGLGGGAEIPATIFLSN